MAGNDYAVGYKRPPVRSRFRPGQSGNPAGRPKGRRNFQTLVRKCLDGEVEVSMGQKRKRMSLMEALLRRLLNKALGGDLKALVQALHLARLYDGSDVEDLESDGAREAQQLELIRQVLAASTTPPEPPPGG